MTRLREALNDLADEAPMVSLVNGAIAGHRRRQRTTRAVAAVAAVGVLLGVGITAATLPWSWADRTATPRATDTVPDLPDGKVGLIGSAYQTSCEVDAQRRIDCGTVEWRVVTRAGTTYRVPQALANTTKLRRVPIAISRDGRKLAYYSHQAQAHVVRDLMTGSEVTSPVKVKEERIGIGSMLVVSDDGRYLSFDPREGSKEPGLLIDMQTGKTVPVPGKYEPVSVKGGVAELVRYIKTDLWLMPVTGGGAPVRFHGTFIMFSELAPDGHTVAAIEFRDMKKRTLTLLDAKSGRTLRKVAIRGLPKTGAIAGTSIWESGSEVTIATRDKSSMITYAVDVRTGQSRQLARHPGKSLQVALPGAAG
ncbi:hypothetical protein [Nonomuraea sp. NEAU-A123]|uniref:hypothetical protein n=1 Tax=Nonomuraea sp. NEAU-A123 TaxID=2839649 RepID=UPI001BE48680|nr:hypothetical protein [Nonomuraea sp. NEAU-A123]MBT2232393.1 hypothetical protein [Nonomuraea sp. NEAU-A123]